MAVFLPFFGYGQIINESIVRASIASNIPTNANKQITAAMLRPVLGQIVTLITNGSNGVVSDSLATVNYIPFFKTTGKIANSPFRVASNNVGLGINPVYPLQILGTVSASQFRVGNTIIADTTATETRLYRRNGKVGLKLGGSNFTNHYENYIHVFRLQDSGEEFARLGYNSGLEVRALGNRTLFQAGYIVTTDTLGTFVPSYSWAKDFTFATDPAANYPTTRMVIKVNGLVGIGRTSPIYGLDVARSFRADSSAYLATIAANRVGIGNTSPVYKLDVTGDLRGTTNAYFATSSGRVGIRRTSPTYMLDVAGTMRSDSSTYLATLAGGLSVGNTTYAGYKLDVAGAARITQDAAFATSSGNVGIGTTSPVGKLDITGMGGSIGLRIKRDSDNVMDVYQGGGVTYFDASTSTGQINFSTNGAGRVRITNAGNFGINTDTPGAKFEVKSSDAEIVRINTVNTSQQGYIGFSEQGNIKQVFGKNVDNTFFLYDAVVGRDIFKTNTSGNLTLVPSAGQVSIGTATPLAKLHVNGTGDTRIRLGNESQQWSMAVSQFGAGNFTLLQEDVAIRLFVSATDGNVGIGTTSPSAPLHVNGAVVFTPMAAASVPTAVEGMIVCVNTTNGTFTSKGFWGYFDGAWTKMSN